VVTVRFPAAQPAPGRLFALQRGFTLLELMVVIIIIGIILSFAGLSARGDSRAAQLKREATRLMALVDMASEQAMMRSEQLAVRFGDRDYEFMSLQNGKWVALHDAGPLRARELPRGMELQLELEENPPPGLQAEDTEAAQVFLLSSGEMTPFMLTFSAPETEQRYVLKATLLGKLELE